MAVEGRITLFAEDADSARKAARAAFDRMIELDGVMSDYRRDSELMRLCAAAGGEGVPVSQDLFQVLARSGEITAATDGAFDVTVGPIVGLWREARRTGVLPSAEALMEAREHSGWRHVRLDEGEQAVHLDRPGMRLDLGGIGKGFAADAAVAELNRAGVNRCLVDMGGDLRAGDPPPGQAGWRVAIEFAEPGAERTTVTLANGAIATSGDSRQFVIIDGVRYSHIVDPRTGMAVHHRIAAAVTAPDAATADALASAMCVLGVEAGARVASRFENVTVNIVVLEERNE